MIFRQLLVSLTIIAAAQAGPLVPELDPLGPCYERLLDGDGTGQVLDEVGMTDRFLVTSSPANDAVVVYGRDSTGIWSLIQVIGAPQIPGYSNFGVRLSLEGDRLALGHYGGLQGPPGRVYIYEYGSASGQFELDGYVESDQSSFGFPGSIDWADEQLVVTTIPAGRLQVYERGASAQGWDQVQALGWTVPQHAGNSRSSAADGDWLVVTGRGIFTAHQGALFVFRRDVVSRRWALVSSREGQGYRRWGEQVALSRNRILVTAPSDPQGVRLRQFRLDPGTGSTTPRPILESPVDGNFGWQVALSADYGIARGGYSDHGLNTGSAWLLEPDPNTGDWRVGRRIRSRLTNQGDLFGRALAASGDRVAASAIQVPGAGAAWHIFEPGLDQDGNSWADEAEVGRNYCLPNGMNTALTSGTLAAAGSQSLGANSLTLHAENLPRMTSGYVLSGGAQALIQNPAGAQGDLCIRPDPWLGRHVESIRNSGGTGTFSVPLDLHSIPTASGAPVVLMPGDVWYFQVWYRDGTSSNFTNALFVGFIP